MPNPRHETWDEVKPAPLSYGLLGFAMLSLIFVCLWRNQSFFHDDAYITLRYARHLLAGLGPIWNKQGPRVEGFTSPLHMLLVAAVSATGIPMMVAARIVNVSSHLALLIYIFFYLKQRVGYLGAQLGVTLVAASWMFLIWDLGGLDAVLYATLATIGVLTATDGFLVAEPQRRRFLIRGSLILAIATLARPESALLLGGSWALILFIPGMTATERLRTLAAAISVAAVILVPVEIFRWIYFHAIAPNTVYAKIGGISHWALIVWGVKYLARFAFAPPFLGVFAVAAGIFNWKKGRFGANCFVIWMFVALNALFVVVSGGDHMLAYRFCLPMYAMLAIILVLSLAQGGFLAQPSAILTISIVLISALTLQIWMKLLNPMATDGAARIGEVVGVYIKGHWPDGSSIALNSAGATPFYADNMQYIDMLGLNDAQIARRRDIPKDGPWAHLVGHMKGDGASVLARKPDFIIIGPAQGTNTETPKIAYFIGDYEIGKSVFFKQNYEQCVVPASDSVVLTYYERRDLSYPCPAVISNP